MKKTFILGVGAQKAGTTWLYHHLSHQPNFNMGCMKEYHVFDALTFDDCHKFLISSFRKIFKTKRFLPYPLYCAYIRYKMQNLPEFYGAYFSRLISGTIDSTGDITPAYSVLTSDTFKKIKDELEKNGFEVKVVFLLRDPFERCWSAVRMFSRMKKYVIDEEKALRHEFMTKGFVFRTNYKRTIEAIESVFEKKNVYYGIYEEMFQGQRMAELSEFCGVIPKYEFLTKEFNVSKKTVGIDEGLKKEIINFYVDTYRFCNDRFPQTKRLWNTVT
jgi:hypothetical protein